jgi:hypothetical protein
MVTKQIQGHDFKNGGPIKQYSIGGLFIGDGSVGTITFSDAVGTVSVSTPNRIRVGEIVGTDESLQVNGDTIISGNLTIEGGLSVGPSIGDVRGDFDENGIITIRYWDGNEWNTAYKPKNKKSGFKKLISSLKNLFTT